MGALLATAVANTWIYVGCDIDRKVYPACCHCLHLVCLGNVWTVGCESKSRDAWKMIWLSTVGKGGSMLGERASYRVSVEDIRGSTVEACDLGKDSAADGG